MYFLEFGESIKCAFSKQHGTGNAVEINNYFLSELDKLISSDAVDESLNMTRVSILFEGFYRHLDNFELKKLLIVVRIKRWEQHFGVPTVTFLLSYKDQINQIKQLFDGLTNLQHHFPDYPWLINKENNFVIDHANNIIIDPNSISSVATPPDREIPGIFTKTHNSSGDYTTAPCDPISRQFIEYAANLAQHGGKVLEIGAAFGAATLDAIAKGATVFCNDINPENLAVVRKRLLETTSEQLNSVTGDNNQLVLIPGELPNELGGLPEHFFDAILICRVLHFFTGKKVEESLAMMSKLLAPGGKIYIVCETPFLKNWQRFIPEFNRRVDCGLEWPGEITNPADYESSGRIASLPKFVHWISKDVLERCLSQAGFTLEHSAYINRSGQFPDDLLLPGMVKKVSAL